LPHTSKRPGVLERLHTSDRHQRARDQHFRCRAPHRLLERHFTVLPDSALTYTLWRNLVARHHVIGVKVHDAYLVAAMKAHGINRILTFNSTDFARYDDVECVGPQTLR
jgi:predicted nucleic acid-binding protein